VGGQFGIADQAADTRGVDDRPRARRGPDRGNLSGHRDEHRLEVDVVDPVEVGLGDLVERPGEEIVAPLSKAASSRPNAATVASTAARTLAGSARSQTV